MNALIKLCLKTNNLQKVDEIKNEFGVTVVYGMSTDKFKLTVWNSSNRNNFNHKDALNTIATDFLLEDEDCMAGNFMQGFNEIMFEIEEL